ncbi:MAG: hypothetical protein HQM08_30085 [Candidatus Riflebacteria bacterium]|nr:hypothetical protein [Candidatus Riflebacteria bacterium]
MKQILFLSMFIALLFFVACSGGGGGSSGNPIGPLNPAGNGASNRGTALHGKISGN